MKNIKSLCGLVVILLLALMLLALPARADQLNIPSDLASVTNATLTSTNGTALTVPKDRDVGGLILLSANGTNNTTYGYDVQVGTNWSTTAPIRNTVTVSSAVTNQGYYFYVSRTNFVGVNQVRFGYLSGSQTSTVTPTSITIDWTH